MSHSHFHFLWLWMARKRFSIKNQYASRCSASIELPVAIANVTKAHGAWRHLLEQFLRDAVAVDASR
jgi:hypothetical protein